MSLTAIKDHEEQGLDLLLVQFKDKPRLEAWLRVYLRQVQLLDAAIYDVLVKRMIDSAHDAQLDTIGQIVGERRLGKPDDEYRVFIRTRIVINRSTGTAPDLLAVLALLSSPSSAYFDDYYPASLLLEFLEQPTRDPRTIYRALQETRAGAVRLNFVSPSTTPDKQFLYSSVGDADIANNGYGDAMVPVLTGLLSSSIGPETPGVLATAGALSPFILSISPSGRSSSGGTLGIYGLNFVNGPNLIVSVGGIQCTSVVFVSANAITCVVPPGLSTGTYDVNITTTTTTAGTSGHGMYSSMGAPVVATVAPLTGAIAGGTSIAVTGSGFVTGATVKIAGVACTGVVFISPTRILCVTPAGTVGARDVLVTNPDAQTGTLVGGFTYAAAPTLTTIAPTTGSTAGGVAFTLTGTGFLAGCTVTINGVPCTSIVRVSATSVTGVAPVGTVGAARDVVITNPDGQSATKAAAYTYILPAPLVTTVSPALGIYTGGTLIAVNGTGFVTGATVKIAGVLCTSIVFVSPTRIDCVTPAGTNGARDVLVTNPDAQTGTLTGGFLYVAAAAPTITSVSPVSGPMVGGTAITLTGTGFVTACTLKINGVACTSVVRVSATSVTAVTPAGSAGAKDLVLTNADTQTGTLAIGFTYKAAPTVTACTPNTSPLAGLVSVTLTGTAFVSGCTVTVGGAAATAVVFVSATSLTCTVPAGTAGAKNIVVTNPDAQIGTFTNGYTYVAAPTVTNVAPAGGALAGGLAITLTGTGFVTGCTVAIAGVPCTSVAFVSATSVTCVAPAGTVGAKNVTLTNPDTQTGTMASGFTYAAAPTITSVSPTSGVTAGGTAITLTGTGFVAGCTLKINNVACTSVVRVSSTSVTAVTPAGTAGAARDLVLTNPDAQTGTLTAGFTYTSATAPTISTVVPGTGSQLGFTTAVITGTLFVSGCTVTIGGTACTGVVFGSATSLTVITPAKAAGTYNVVVTNPNAETSGATGNGKWITTASATPQTTLGARLKRLYMNSSGTTTRSWTDLIAADVITSTGTPSALLTTKKSPGVGVLTTHSYQGSGNLGGATYKNLLLFGAFKFPADIAGTDFNLFYIDQWNCYLDATTGLVHCFASPTPSGEAVSNASMKDAAWHRFIVHYTNDGVAGVGKLWIDGTLQTLQQTTGGDVIPTTGLAVGSYQGTGSEVGMSLAGIALGAAGVPFTGGEITAIDAFLADWV